MRSDLISSGALIGMVVLALASPAGAARPGSTQRVSVGVGDVQADDLSNGGVISADGSTAAFASYGNKLVPGDVNPHFDVFVRDLRTGTTRLVSATATDGGAAVPALSADGRFVAYTSRATTVVPGDTNERWDVFVFDGDTGATQRVSVASDGSQAGGGAIGSVVPRISGDGRLVAFQSDSPELVAGDSNGVTDVFVHDRATGSTTRVSTAADGAEGNAVSQQPSLSLDGSTIAFETLASNLVPGDANAGGDIVVRDLTTGAVSFGALGHDGAQPVAGGSGGTGGPSLNADGTVLAFSSASPVFVPADSNNRGDAFVRDLRTGIVQRVSVTSAGAEVAGVSGVGAISADGRYVGFQSEATTLVPGDTNNTLDAFVHDRLTATTERISVDPAGAGGLTIGGGLPFGSAQVQPAADGRLVAFLSFATNLVDGDTNGQSDIFVRDRGPELGIQQVALTTTAEGGTGVAGAVTASGAVVSAATDAPGDGDARVGAELTGASLVLRPELGDLLVRIQLSGLPGATTPSVPNPLLQGPVSAAGLPGVVHGIAFTAGATAYEVRAGRVGAGGAPGTFTLLRCDASCSEVATLVGGLGTTGRAVTAAVPLAAIGAPAQLTAVRAFVGLGAPQGGPVRELDTAALPSASLPRPTLTLVADGVQHDVAVGADGRFATAVPGSAEHLDATTCLGERCTTTTLR